MARFQASCQTCGEVAVTARQVEVAVHDQAWSGFYEFNCPHCLAPVRRAAPQRTLKLLALSGATLRPHMPALTLDDLLDFHELLASEDRLACLVETFSARGPNLPGR